MNFQECMDFIGSYSRLGGKVTDLSRAQELVDRIGNPEKKLKFIHISGTNGKGSTLEYIANALMYAGYKTGKFTSPFVTHYTDRIRINDREIDEKSLGEICTYVAENVADRKYSQFEITMAIAMLWYAKEKCDIVVLETGIGGLLDSTNVIPSPLLSVITSVSLDHTEILGDTIVKIAEQKAGIIKKNSAVVCSPLNDEEVIEIVHKTADKMAAEFILPEKESIELFHSDLDGVRYSYYGEYYKTAMAGQHQAFNSITALEACQYLTKKGFVISDDNIRRAIETTQINARQQYINANPPFLIDGGHNPDGVSALAHSVWEIKSLKEISVYTIMGMVDSKDYVHSVETIARNSDRMFTVDGFAANCVPADRLAEIAGEYTEAEPSTLIEAVEKASALALGNNGIVVICGSLYLASEYLNMRENN